MCLINSVGEKCANQKADVKTVQILLNLNSEKLAPLPLLQPTGLIDDQTLKSIREFQRRVMSLPQPDGKIGVNGKTLRALQAGMLSEFTRDKLAGIMINARAEIIDRYFKFLVASTQENDIVTPLRMAHFLAQLAHESGEFRFTEELASGDAYEGRADLGNTMPGDGRRFKGRGLIQLTGRNNYTRYGESRQKDFITGDNPKLLSSDPATAVDVSCWFWVTHGLNAIADKDDVVKITRRINGGENGLADRKAKLVRAKFFLNVPGVSSSVQS